MNTKTIPPHCVQIADRIREYDDKHTQLFTEVADSGQLDDVLNNRNVSEGCYVIKLDKKATTETPYQRVTERYQIITICQNYTDAYGSAVGEMAELMQEAVFFALSGYTCRDNNNGQTEPLEFVTGGLIDLKNSLHIWSDIYQLEYTQKHNQQQE